MDFLNTDEKRNRRLVHLPMGRFGEAVEIAKGALFRTLCYSYGLFIDSNYFTVGSDESSYITVRDFLLGDIEVT